MGNQEFNAIAWHSGHPEKSGEFLRPRGGYDNAKPVFFGHYWMTARPVQSPTIACVDFSAAKDGPLVAYRWDGEPQLDDRNFASVG